MEFIPTSRNSFIQNNVLYYRSKLFVNFLPYVAESILFDIFASIGIITVFHLPRGPGGEHRGYALVTYKFRKDAARAVEVLNGLKVSSKTLLVEFARVSNREMQNAKLFVSNLPEKVTSSVLKEMFQTYGTIISCRVIYSRDNDFSPPVSCGYGFVLFNFHAEALKAIECLHGVVPYYFNKDVGHVCQIGYKTMNIRLAQSRLRATEEIFASVENCNQCLVSPEFINVNYFPSYPLCYNL